MAPCTIGQSTLALGHRPARRDLDATTARAEMRTTVRPLRLGRAMKPSPVSRLPLVVIDPGHGGSKAVGGSSPNNAHGPPPDALLEKTLTLAVARRVPALLQRDAEVVLTRADDRNLSLAARAAVARAKGAKVFVSIHFNGSADKRVDGTEVWVAKDASPGSLALAKDLQRRLVAATGVRDRGVRRENFGVILRARHASDTAACLAEIAFLSNPQQAQRLRSGAYLDRLAQALADAVRQALSATTARARGLELPGGLELPSGLELPHGLAEEYSDGASPTYGRPSTPTVAAHRGRWPELLPRAAGQSLDEAQRRMVDEVERARAAIPHRLQRARRLPKGLMYGGRDVGEPAAVAAARQAPESRRSSTQRIDLLVWKEVGSEGGASSINTWDDQIFTWGKGWSSVGALQQVLARLFKLSPRAQEALLSAGVALEGRRWLAVDTQAGRVVTDEAARRLLARDERLLSLFVILGEDPPYAGPSLEAQWAQLRDNAGAVPSYANTWSDEAIRLGVHLSHWLPVGGWRSRDYEATRGDLRAMVLEFGAALGAHLNRAKRRAVPSGAWIVDAFDVPGHLRSMAGGAGWRAVAAESPNARPLPADATTNPSWRGHLFLGLPLAKKQTERMFHHLAPRAATGLDVDAEEGASTAYGRPARPESLAVVQRAVEGFLGSFSAIEVKGARVSPPYFINRENEAGRLRLAQQHRAAATGASRAVLGELKGPTRARLLFGKSTRDDLRSLLERAVEKGAVAAEGAALRAWLVRYGIGVDCSGFVSQCINEVLRAAGQDHAKGLSETGTNAAALRGGQGDFAKVGSPLDLRPGDTMWKEGHIRVVMRVRRAGAAVEFDTAESSSIRDIGPTPNTWRYPDGRSFKGLSKRSGEAWRAAPKDAQAYGRYKPLVALVEG